MDMRMGFLLVPALGLALAACGDGDQARAPAGGMASATADGPQHVVARQPVPVWQSVSARVTSVDEARVVARIPGILEELTVLEGDRVDPGQLIGRIVDSQLAFQASAAAAQAAAARAHAAEAEADLERVRYLHANGVYAQARLDQAEAAAAAAQGAARAAAAQQDAIGAVAGQGAVRAPSAGRVLQADVPRGAPVSPGMPIAVITAGPTVLRLDLPEALAGRVKLGAQVAAVMPGGQQLRGQVTRLYPAVTAGQIAADAAVPGLPDDQIGRRIAARVEAGTRPALIVPAAFIVTRFGIDYVRLLGADGAVTDVPVQTAPAGNADQREVLSGIAAGDRLVAPRPAPAAGKADAQ